MKSYSDMRSFCNTGLRIRENYSTHEVPDYYTEFNDKGDCVSASGILKAVFHTHKIPLNRYDSGGSLLTSVILKFKQGSLFIQSACIACQTAVCSDNSVTGNYYRDRVMSNSAADCLS